jgi:hypothetical protein
VETWRILATALLGLGGLVLVLFAMAQARDRRGATGGQVALTGAITFAVVFVLCVLTVTVLPSVVVWPLVVVVGIAVTVFVLVS